MLLFYNWYNCRIFSAALGLCWSDFGSGLLLMSVVKGYKLAIGTTILTIIYIICICV